MLSNHIIINVGRQLGSGGHDIGRMLALDFGAKYYDKELLNLAAKESGLSEHFFEKNDDRQGFTQDSFFQFQSDAIRKAADESSCVFVGRCADYILRDRKDVVNIFITASMNFRIEQIMAKQGFTNPQQARRYIEQGESKRADYYNYYTGKKWGHAGTRSTCTISNPATRYGMLAISVVLRWLSAWLPSVLSALSAVIATVVTSG